MASRFCWRHLLAALVALSAAPAFGQGISAETPLRPATRAVALTNARVVVAPGRVLDRATVVVRDGRIEAVGPRVAVPFDADVVRADSFTVYAGFIDAFGYEGVPKPSADREPYRGDPGDPPRELAGIVPDRDVRATLTAEDAAVKGLREAGFTVAHVAPRDGLLSGQGSVVLLRDPGRYETMSDLVLAGPVSLVARIAPARGVYPGTPMGVLAVLRETAENTRRRGATRIAYTQTPGAVDRPRYDPVLDAFALAVDGQRQFVFVADGWLDGFRALRASTEMGLKPVLAGVPDASPLIDRLRQSGTAVFAPLALPDTVKADSSARALPLPSTTPGEVSFVTDRRIVSYRDVSGETTALTGQRIASVRRAEQSPSRLAAAGVPFAFATFDVKAADVHKNLRRMIAAGLAPDAALAALTTDAARLLGLSATLGTVEPGKLANLVVTTGDVFADTTQIRYVFVEGVRHEIEAKKKGKKGGAAADPTAVVQVVGTWDTVASTPIGDQEGTLTITGAPGSFAGQISNQGQTTELDQVTLDGNVLVVRFSTQEMGSVTVTVTITGDTFEGLAEVGPLGSIPITGTRRPN